MLQTFGLLGFLNIPLNPANLIALPLILGIGVDYGVHIVHEFRECKGPYRMSPGTAVAVLVDALTTIVGFGSLMIASHQGLAEPGPRVDDRGDLLLVQLAGDVAGAADLDDAKSTRGSCRRLRACRRRARRACPRARAA